ncbi:MAG: hypothetical protein ABJC39_10245 [Chloroflexota bacterium]
MPGIRRHEHRQARPEDDRTLLLSYVIWPTELIDANLQQALHEGIANATYEPRF